MLRRESAEPLLMIGLRGDKSGRELRRGLFGTLERDSWLRQAATVFAVEQFETVHADTPNQFGEDGPFMAFLKWVIENQDQIIAFIEKIIALFAT